MWGSFFGWQNSLFPEDLTAIRYEATSPTLNKRMVFTGKEDINAEVERILLENKDKPYSAGQALYYSVPFFCNAKIFAKQIYSSMLEEYQIIQDYGVPLASSIDKVPVIRTRYFNIIRQELLNCQRRQMEMNNG